MIKIRAKDEKEVWMMSRWLAEFKKNNFSLMDIFLIVICGYFFGLLGWETFSSGNINSLFLLNQMSLSFKSWVVFGVIFCLILAAKMKPKTNFRSKLGLLAVVLAVASFIPVLNFEISQQSFFSFLNYVQRSAFIWLRAIWMWAFVISLVWFTKIDKLIADIEGRLTGKAIFGLVSLWLVISIWFGFRLHNSFGTSSFDLGIYDQTMWQMVYGHSWASTLNDTGHIWGAHFQPILMLLAPLYWLWSDAKMLIALEALVIAIGAIPVYRMTQRRFKRPFISLAMVIGYLLFLGNGAALGYSFHPSTLLGPILLFSYDYFEQKKWRLNLLFLLLALLVKENAGIYLAVLGLVLILKDRRYLRLGISYIVMGAIWTLLIMGIIIPFFSSTGYRFFSYQSLGNNLHQAAQTMVINPFYAIRQMLNEPTRAVSFFSLLLGSGFVAFLTPSSLLLLPTLAEKFFSSRVLMWGIDFHYGAPLCFGFVVATIDGLKRLQSFKIWDRLKINQSSVLSLAGTVIIGLSLVASINGTTLIGKTMRNKSIPVNSFDLRELEKLIPLEAAVSAQGSVVPHFSKRKEIFQYPKIGAAKYIVFNSTTSYWPLGKDEYFRNIEKMKSDKGWKLIYDKDGFLVWQKASSQGLKY